MINRVLIRIKVVQMLYSYLLTKSEFKIEPAPESATRDKRFAYTVYIDTLLMILRLSVTTLDFASFRLWQDTLSIRHFHPANLCALSAMTTR